MDIQLVFARAKLIFVVRVLCDKKKKKTQLEINLDWVRADPADGTIGLSKGNDVLYQQDIA